MTESANSACEHPGSCHAPTKFEELLEQLGAEHALLVKENLRLAVENNSLRTFPELPDECHSWGPSAPTLSEREPSGIEATCKVGLLSLDDPDCLNSRKSCISRTVQDIKITSWAVAEPPTPPVLSPSSEFVTQVTKDLRCSLFSTGGGETQTETDCEKRMTETSLCTSRSRRTSIQEMFEVAGSFYSTVMRSVMKADKYKADSTWLINPDRSPFLARWDTLLAAALAYVAVFTPVQISMLETKVDALFVVNLLVDAIFICDMVLQFFIMYPKKTNYGYTLERNHADVCRHYLSTWFPVDMLCAISYDLLAVLFDHNAGLNWRTLKMIRMLGLIKFARLFRARRLVKRFESRMSITYGRLALLEFFIVLSLIAHWLANLWALTLVIVDEDGQFPRWIDRVTSMEEKVSDKTKDTPWKLYLTCLYFASYTLTSVGYGDIAPSNIVEIVACNTMVVVSGISWAVVLGEVCTTLANFDKDEKTFRSTMDEVAGMMQDRVMSSGLRYRLRSFFLSNKDAQRRLRHQDIISSLSPGLRSEVIMETSKMWLEKVPLLNQLREDSMKEDISTQLPFFNFVAEVCQYMDQAVHSQAEVFGRPQVLYILNRGLVNRNRRVHKSGDVWGSDFVLSDCDLIDKSQCLALTYVELTVLTRDVFFRVADGHRKSCPEAAKRIRRFCCWLAFQRALLQEAKKRRKRRKYLENKNSSVESEVDNDGLQIENGVDH